MNTIPSCDLYDYLEIACLFHYRVKLELLSGESITGVAKTMAANSQKQEVFYLENEDNTNDTIEVMTKELVSMEVLTPGARFQQVSFKQQ